MLQLPVDQRDGEACALASLDAVLCLVLPPFLFHHQKFQKFLHCLKREKKIIEKEKEKTQKNEQNENRRRKRETMKQETRNKKNKNVPGSDSVDGDLIVVGLAAVDAPLASLDLRIELICCSM